MKKTQELSSQKQMWSQRIFKKQPMILHLFRFFASLQLAVFLLGTLMIIFSVGTFVESLQGARAAKILVYDTSWMTAVLFLLMLNLIASALDRLPWGKKHIGFVMTHLGIILILAGSFMTQHFMLDATMPVIEGRSEHKVTLDEPVIYLFSEKKQKEWRVPLPKHAFAWQGRQVLHDAEDPDFPVKVSILSDYPKARIKETIVETQTGPAAVHLKLKNSFMEQALWLVKDDRAMNQVQMGPALFKFADDFLQAQPETGDVSGGYLEFQFEEAIRHIPVDPKIQLPQTFAIEGTGYRVRIEAVYHNAVIVDAEITEGPNEQEVEDSGMGRNPAVVFFLEGPNGMHEFHTAFSKFPEFPTQHGMKPSASGAKIFYRENGTGSRDKTHEVRFIQKENELHYQIVDGVKVLNGQILPGDKIQPGWMGLEIELVSYYPHSGMEKQVTAEPNTSQSTQVTPAVQIRVATPQDQLQLWLAQGMPEVFDLAGGRYTILYGQAKEALGFEIILKDFKIKHYPGTSRPAGFESDVVLKDDARGVEREATISMNEPLVYRGMRIFQASYVQSPGQPEISVFSVGYDPGIMIKYTGAIVMVAGILIMFYTRKPNKA
ncbi:MAG: cytochrome c biogenesis protein ResB [Candidatus Omnitrophica bacterium]|nr:cytochrome c biogenesis protein ResB [Candidatus Omnitrophota bacterium]